jgi:hypothetical protein
MSGTQATIDLRLISVQVQVNNTLQTFTQTARIRARGEKFANALQNTCEVEISNLDTPTRNYLLTETSPFNQNRTPKLCTVSVGRVSTGLFLLYTGNIMTTGITQPPDITVKLKCGTAHFKKGSVGRRSGGKSTRLSTLANAVASNIGVSLNMQTPDINISNYTHNGNAESEVDTLGQAGNCQAYIDDDHLILKPVMTPLEGVAYNLSETTGMIGVPEATEQGLKVKMLWSPSVKLGGALNITSVLNPSINGTFVIFKLRFDVASRETEFYYEAECLRAAT